MSIQDFGNRLQLLADRSIIERLVGEVQLRLHHPSPRELVPVTQDEQGSTYRYMSVFHDGEKYRMYYALGKVRYDEKGEKIKEPERICYAESCDGKVWEKPSLGLFEFRGSRENNIIWMEDEISRFGVSGFSVFKDENPACPEEHRYKAIAEAGPIGKRVLGCNGLLAFGSPDGIHWKMLAPHLIVTGGPGRGAFDTQNVAFWDGERGEYRLYRREVFNEGPLNIFRDVLTATSPDFLHWSEPQRLRYPGAIPDQLYTNNVIPYFRAPHLFIGFPVRYVERPWSDAIAALPERERRMEVIRQSGAEPGVEDPTGRCGHRGGTALTDALFMIGRDGVTFDRWDEAFIRPGLRTLNNWFYPDNFPAWGVVPTRPDIEGGAASELSFYVSEGGRRSSSNLCRRYTLRLDGFVSANASRAGGEIVTQPFRFKGDTLTVNFSASAAGHLRFELQDEKGSPVPGFELEQCIEVLGDDLERPVCWEGNDNLFALAGRVLKMRVQLVDADLYSFRFQ